MSGMSRLTRKLILKGRPVQSVGDNLCEMKPFLFWTIFWIFACMEAKVEQRTVLSFLCKGGKSPMDCWREMRPVFGDNTMSLTRIRVWHK